MVSSTSFFTDKRSSSLFKSSSLSFYQQQDNINRALPVWIGFSAKGHPSLRILIRIIVSGKNYAKLKAVTWLHDTEYRKVISTGKASDNGWNQKKILISRPRSKAWNPVSILICDNKALQIRAFISKWHNLLTRMSSEKVFHLYVSFSNIVYLLMYKSAFSSFSPYVQLALIGPACILTSGRFYCKSGANFNHL